MSDLENNTEIQKTVEITPAFFGQSLLTARTDADYSREALAASTRIMLEFIVALEEGNFELLPSRVFCRGFIKSICKAIHIESEKFLILFDEASQYDPSAPLKPVTKGSLGSTSRRVDGVWGGKEIFSAMRKLLETLFFVDFFRGLSALKISVLAGAVGLVSLAVAGMFMLSESNDRGQKKVKTMALTQKASSSRYQNMQTSVAETAKFEQTSVNTVAEIPASVEPQKAVAAPESEAVPTEVATEEAKVQQDEIVVSANGHNVSIKVLEPVKVRLKVDKNRWQTMELAPDDYHYVFVDGMKLLIFDASAVEVEFDGRPLGNLGGKGRVRRLSFVNESDDEVFKNNVKNL